MSASVQIHNLEAAAVFHALGSRSEGLSSAEAVERSQQVGANSVKASDPWRLVRNLLSQLTNFFTLLLFLAAGISFFAEYVQPGQSMHILGWALLAVALLNALFCFFQEFKAEQAMAALQQFLPVNVEVLRSNLVVMLPAEQIVPGDLLLLKEGDRIPADARLIEAKALLISNAPLTGESQPCAMTADPVSGRLIESSNIVFAGGLVLKGSGIAVVFATGLRTEFGKLAYLSQAIQRSPSHLERQIAHMTKVLTVVAVGLGGAFFIYGVLSGRSLWINLVFMMGIIVANVPEGLLPTFTLALAMGSLRMARKNVLVTSLNAVEAFGATQVICTDKTGTLTQNKLAVTSMVHYPSMTEVADASLRQQLLEMALGAGDINTTEQGFSGDPLDVAIAEAFSKNGGNVALSEENRHHFFPFDVDKRRAAGIVTINGQLYFVVKGAWESLSPFLGGLVGVEGEITAANEESLARGEQTMTELAADGYRVVAVAYKALEGLGETIPEQEQLEQDLLLAGFLGVEDPIRDEVPAALDKCYTAGIKVIMITGDHPQTAKSVAVRCGIVPGNAPDQVMMTGEALENLSESEIGAAIENGVCLFARTSPAQKMKIVLALKSMNLVVAMTGDGVNDAPALKAADIGIAMGKSGTDVARASAQIILLDDNFASIVAGIEEGRTVFFNIRKFTNYVLVSNGPEIIPYLLYILFPVPLALSVIHILSIDLGTDIVPSMALGQEPPDPEVMRQPPSGQGLHLLSPGLVLHSYLFLGLLEAIWSLSLFFYVLHVGGWQYGTELALNSPLYHSAAGIALSSILLMQIGNLIGRRYTFRSGLDLGIFKNRLMLGGIIIQLVFSWALLYWPPMQNILGTGPVSWQIYLFACLGMPFIFGVDYARKLLWKRFGCSS
jgi:sodium/potassium-transporting ATPase subunit alpha